MTEIMEHTIDLYKMNEFEKMLGGCEDEMRRCNSKRCAVPDENSVVGVEYAAFR
jgi:hypothetical protein